MSNSLYHPFLTAPPSWRCHIKATPSIPHSTTSMEVSYQGYTIPSALHNLHEDVISSLHRLILSPPPSRRCQIKCTSSVPHSSAFVEVLDRHAFLTPPRLRWHFKSTPSIHRSTTFVKVSHHVYTILSSLRNLSWSFVSNQVYTIYSSLHNLCGGVT